jgi:hypothetical protein
MTNHESRITNQITNHESRMAKRTLDPNSELLRPSAPAARGAVSVDRLHSSFVIRHSSSAIRHSSFLILLLLTACAGYRLGPTGGQTAGARSIQINPFLNQTIEPRLSDALTHALRKQIQQDGTFRLNTADDGDIILTGAIIKYDRLPIALRSRDALTPSDYRITITARITARERVSGKVLLDREVTGRTEVRAGSDLYSAERQGIPIAADFLAASATSLLADGSW